MITYTTVTTPQYADATSTTIGLMVTFNHVGYPIYFTAADNDVEEYGRELFAKATAGDFGIVAEYTPPSTTAIDLTALSRHHRNIELSRSDWSMLPDAPLTTAQKTMWIDYRAALRDITQQPGFPDSIEWPTQPI